MDSKTTDPHPLAERLQDEMLDNLDEEIELEFDDHRLEAALGELGGDRPRISWIAAPISGNCCACNESWSNCRTGSCIISSN